MIRGLVVTLIVLILGCLTLATPVRAELTPYFSYTVPGLNHSIKRIDLADIDGDSVAEVFAFDAMNLLMYCPTSDQILFNLRFDSLSTLAGLDTCNYPWNRFALLLADVNRDSLLDASFLWSVSCQDMSELEWRYLLFFWDDVASNSAPKVELDFTLESTLGVGMLEAIDIDNDGYDNLVLSVDSSVWQDLYMFSASDDSYGKTLIYYSFPDSLLSQTPQLFSSVALVGDISRTLALTSVTQHWDDYAGIGPNSQHTACVTLMDSSLIIRGDHCSIRDRFCYNSGEGAGFIDDLTVHAVGDIRASASGQDLLCTYEWRQSCYDYDSVGCDIMLFEFVSPDSIDEVWHAAAPVNPLSDFFFDAAFPDQFFAFAGDTLMRFSATDGALIKRYNSLPTGMKFWDYPYGGDEPYLVIVIGQTVSYYTFDEVTDVKTNTPAALPATFTLGQPYPNPFNPNVTVPIALNSKGHLKVEVYNPLGQRVSVLHDAVASAGEMTLSWDATNFGSGVYLIKATLGKETKTAKAMLVK